MSTKLSFSFGKPKPKTTTVGTAPSLSLSKPAAFASVDDDEPVDGPLSASSSARVDVNRRLQSTSTAGGSLSRTAKKKLQQEVLVDPTVYEYDEVYDRMKEAELKAKAVKEDEAAVRKVCTWPHSLHIYVNRILIIVGLRSRRIAEIYWFTSNKRSNP